MAISVDDPIVAQRTGYSRWSYLCSPCDMDLGAMLAIPTLAQAQEPVAALKTCVTDNTSGRDRKDLAKWVFFAMAAHPEMKQYADGKVAAAVDESSQKLAALVTRLLTESCVNEVRAVMKTGQGSQALRYAFESLGQLAMQELMADKTVQDTMSLFQRYVDQTRLKEALADK
jgi:hypothetical protein